MNLKEIKEIAKKFTPEEIEICINETLKNGEPSPQECKVSGDIVEKLNTLAKAQFVRELVEKGYSEIDAIRELARKIREVQSIK